MHPRMEELAARYTVELNGLSLAETERHPADDSSRWNARQIVEHLVLTYRVTGSVLQERLDKRRPSLATSTLKQRMARTIVIRFGLFPVRRPAPDNVTPTGIVAGSLSGADLASFYRGELEAIDQRINQCEECFGAQDFATHQIFGSLSAKDWRRFHIVHSRHHLKGIAALKSFL